MSIAATKSRRFALRVHVPSPLRDGAGQPASRTRVHRPLPNRASRSTRPRPDLDERYCITMATTLAVARNSASPCDSEGTERYAVVDADRNAMLVGREAELAALRAALDEMHSVRSITVWLGGEAG